MATPINPFFFESPARATKFTDREAILPRLEQLMTGHGRRLLIYLNEAAARVDEVWSVCFDEFQEIRRLGGERVDWRLREIIQAHKNVNYIFTGSDRRIISWMTDPTAPCFKQLAQMEVGPIDPVHMANWIHDRAKIGGVVDFPHAERIVAMAGPCTGDIVRLAKTVFDAAARKAPGDIVATSFDAIALAELYQDFLNQWRPLGVTERALLRAIAAGKLPTASETLRVYGINAPSSAAHALENLVGLQILMRADGKVNFDNPFFRRWVDFNGCSS